MCPPIDPILPLGPVDGGTYVDRAAYASRVTRRRPREEDDARDRGHAHHQDDPEGEEHGCGGPGSRAPIADAGAYDDHGRLAHGDEVDPPGAAHIDRTA